MSFSNITGFDWDEGNKDKNVIIHNVSNAESEEIFFNNPLVTSKDEKHSTEKEQRLFALGKTNEGRKLFIVFTIRDNLIRIISARDMSQKERKIYEKEEGS